MTLTAPINLAYADLTTAKSVVGFSSLQVTKGASAPKPLGAFFTPIGFLFGGMQWEAFGLAGFLWRRSANPLYAVTTIFSRIGCRLVITKPLDIPIMNTQATELARLQCDVDAVRAVLEYVLQVNQTRSQYQRNYFKNTNILNQQMMALNTISRKLEGLQGGAV